jgi:uncharacterized damage-inducible protein DinB
MQKLNNISLLFKHMEWADATVWQSVLNHSPANNDAKIRKLLLHIHMVQQAFFYVWTKQTLDFPKESDFPELIDIAKWGYEYYTQVNKYFDAFDKNDLNKIIEIPWANRLEKIINRKPEDLIIEETMLQVAMHSTYHRGQVNARLRDLEGEPQPNDFIYWVWLGKPTAVWDKVYPD